MEDIIVFGVKGKKTLRFKLYKNYYDLLELAWKKRDTGYKKINDINELGYNILEDIEIYLTTAILSESIL